MAYEIKELSVGGILDQAVRIVKEHFALLLGIVVLLYLPVNLISGIIVGNAAQDLLKQMQPPQPDPFLVLRAVGRFYLIMTPFLLLNILIVFPLTNSAIIYATANLYLGKFVSVKIAILKGFKLIIPVLMTNMLWFLAIVGGSILCLIPGIIFFFWFALSNHVVVIEGIWGPDALGRSRKLMKDNVGMFFVLGLLVVVINVLINITFSLLGPSLLQVILTTIAGAILLIFFTAIYVVFYFSCRCKNEHFDLNMLAESVAVEAYTTGAT